MGCNQVNDKKQVLFLFLLLSIAAFSQQITGNQLLEKAIHFHDPKGNWKTFNGELFVTMKTPDQIKRKSEIRINLPKEYFYIKSYKDASTEEYTVNKGICSKVVGGNKNPSNDPKKTCKRANLYKDYYTFLYGLPMKLKDEGTIVHQKVCFCGSIRVYTSIIKTQSRIL